MAQTIGHSEAYGGLRGHSIGDIYPMIVVCIGTRWKVKHPHYEGFKGKGYATAKQAHSRALLYKADFLKAKSDTV